MVRLEMIRKEDEAEKYRTTAWVSKGMLVYSDIHASLSLGHLVILTWSRKPCCLGSRVGATSGFAPPESLRTYNQAQHPKLPYPDQLGSWIAACYAASRAGTAPTFPMRERLRVSLCPVRPVGITAAWASYRYSYGSFTGPTNP
jgi:hypothetical protein